MIFSHSMGIMHRDVKPHNVMIDHQQRKECLAEFLFIFFALYFLEFSIFQFTKFFEALYLDINLYTHIEGDFFSIKTEKINEIVQNKKINLGLILVRKN